MLKTTRSSITSAFGANDNEVVDSVAKSGDSVSRLDALRKKPIKSKSQNLRNRQLNNSNAMKKPKFLTSEARGAFNYLK